jgi:hypothetical protein
MPYDAMGNYIPDQMGMAGPQGQLGSRDTKLLGRNGSGLNLPIPVRHGSDGPTTRADFERIQQNPNANQQFNFNNSLEIHNRLLRNG